MTRMPRVPREVGDYKMNGQIGRGSFATVWQAEHKLSKTPVAIKAVLNSSIADDDAKTRFVREVNLIKQMDHPFISKLYDVIETEDYTFLVMEFAERQSMLSYVNIHGRLSEAHARRYFGQLVSAIEYLHDERHVAHRDLKAENVLLDRNLNIRLIDFGLSNSFSSEAPELSTACGSPAYAAPEMVRGQAYTKNADVWSAGILLYAMTTSQLPFEDENMQRLLQKIVYTEPRYPSYLSPQLIDLLRKILVKSPETRLTLEMIKAHPWFSQSEYGQIMQMHFSTDDQWRVGGVDRDVVQRISALGIDVKNLANHLLCGEYNRTTALYLMLRRDEITDRIKSMMDSMKAGNSAAAKPATDHALLSRVVGGKPHSASPVDPGTTEVTVGEGTPTEETKQAVPTRPVALPMPVRRCNPGVVVRLPMAGQRQPVAVPSSGRKSDAAGRVVIKLPCRAGAAQQPPKSGGIMRGRVNSLVV